VQALNLLFISDFQHDMNFHTVIFWKNDAGKAGNKSLPLTCNGSGGGVRGKKKPVPEGTGRCRASCV